MEVRIGIPDGRRDVDVLGSGARSSMHSEGKRCVKKGRKKNENSDIENKRLDGACAASAHGKELTCQAERERSLADATAR